MRAFTIDLEGLPSRGVGTTGHVDLAGTTLSRRGFLGGAAAMGGAALLGSSVLGSTSAFAAPSSNPTPNPIPGGIQPAGPGTPVFHVLLPGPDSPNAEPATITDFNGFVGIAHTQGTGTGIEANGTTHQLLYDLDMRFQKGVYVGQDGKVHQGTFGFIWMDLYEGRFDFQNFTTQVHDFDPGIDPYPEGLFWTIPLPASDVEIQMGAGRASMTASNLAIRDFFNIPNALFHLQTPASVPATVTFDITWHGPVTDRVQVNDPTTGFAAELFRNQATSTWSGHNGAGFSFVSNPSTTSVFAEVGHLSNGAFFTAAS